MSRHTHKAMGSIAALVATTAISATMLTACGEAFEKGKPYDPHEEDFMVQDGSTAFGGRPFDPRKGDYMVKDGDVASDDDRIDTTTPPPIVDPEDPFDPTNQKRSWEIDINVIDPQNVDPWREETIELEPGNPDSKETHITIQRISEPDDPFIMVGWRNGKDEGNLHVVDVLLLMSDYDFEIQPWAERVKILSKDEYVLVDNSIVDQYYIPYDVYVCVNEFDPIKFFRPTNYLINWEGERIAGAAPERLAFGHEPMYDEKTGTPAESTIPEDVSTHPERYKVRYWLTIAERDPALPKELSADYGTPLYTGGSW